MFVENCFILVGKTSDGKATSFRATNVPAGKTYEFRVRAVSEIGESESNVSKLVTVKDPYGIWLQNIFL